MSLQICFGERSIIWNSVFFFHFTQIFSFALPAFRLIFFTTAIVDHELKDPRLIDGWSPYDFKRSAKMLLSRQEEDFK